MGKGSGNGSSPWRKTANVLMNVRNRGFLKQNVIILCLIAKRLLSRTKRVAFLTLKVYSCNQIFYKNVRRDFSIKKRPTEVDLINNVKRTIFYFVEP